MNQKRGSISPIRTRISPQKKYSIIGLNQIQNSPIRQFASTERNINGIKISHHNQNQKQSIYKSKMFEGFQSGSDSSENELSQTQLENKQLLKLININKAKNKEIAVCPHCTHKFSPRKFPKNNNSFRKKRKKTQIQTQSQNSQQQINNNTQQSFQNSPKNKEEKEKKNSQTISNSQQEINLNNLNKINSENVNELKQADFTNILNASIEESISENSSQNSNDSIVKLQIESLNKTIQKQRKNIEELEEKLEVRNNFISQLQKDYLKDVTHLKEIQFHLKKDTSQYFDVKYMDISSLVPLEHKELFEQLLKDVKSSYEIQLSNYKTNNDYLKNQVSQLQSEISSLQNPNILMKQLVKQETNIYKFWYLIQEFFGINQVFKVFEEQKPQHGINYKQIDLLLSKSKCNIRQYKHQKEQMDIQIENIKQSFLEQQQFLKQQLENTKQELRQVKQERLKEIQQAKFETQNLVEEQAQEREIQMHQQYQDKYKAIYEQVTTSGSANIIQELEKKASLKQWFYVVKLISLQEKMKKQNQSEEFEVKNLLKKAGKENIFDIQKMKGKEIDPEILEHIEEQSKVIEKLQIENKEQTTKIEYLNMKHQRNSNNLELLNDQKEVYENQLRESNEELKSYKRIFEKLKDDIKYTETETGEQVQPKLIQKVKKVKKQFLQAIKKQENPDYLIEEINKQINDAQEQHKILFDSQHNKGVMTRIQDLTINLANLEEQAEQNFNEEEELVDSSNIKTPRPLLKTQQVQTDEKYSQANSGNLPRIISKRNQEGVLKRSMTVNANSPNNINSAKNDKNQRNQGQIIEENDDYYEDNNDNPDKNSLEYSNNYSQKNNNYGSSNYNSNHQSNSNSPLKNQNLLKKNATQNKSINGEDTDPLQNQKIKQERQNKTILQKFNNIKDEDANNQKKLLQLPQLQQNQSQNQNQKQKNNQNIIDNNNNTNQQDHDNEFLNQSNKNFQNHTQDNLQQQNTVSFKKSNVNLRDPNSTQNQLKQQSQTQPFQGQNNKNFINNSDNQQINTPFNNGNYNQNNQQKGNATIQPYNLDRKVQLDNQISIRKNHQFSNLFGHINFDSENSIKKRTQSLHDGRKQNVLLQKYEQQLLNQNQNQNQNQNEYNNKNAFIPHFKTAHKNYQQDEDKNNNQNQNQNGNIDPEVLNQGEHFFDFKINQFVQVKNSPESAQIKFKKITNQNFENVIDPTKPQQLREFNTNQEEKQFLYQYLQDPRNILQYKQNQTKKLGINQKQAQFSTVPQSPQHKKQKQNTGQIKDFKAYMHGLELEKQKNLQQQKQSQKNDKQQTLREMIISGLSQKPQIMDYYNKKYQNLSAKDKFIKLQNSQFNHSILNNNVNLNQSFDDSKIINSSSHQQKLNLQNILGQQKSQNIKLQYQQQQQQQQQQQLNLNQKQTGDIQLQQQTVPLQKNNILNGIRAQTPNTQRRKLSNKM